jgi:tRNA U38,U39,U40 pseudouridine synthase TruA
VHAILHARDRSIAGQVAPPHGLVLWEVGYDGVRWDDPGTQEV